MRSTKLRAELINDASMVISLHHIIGTFNLGTHVQCVCGAIVRCDDWYRHIAEIIVDRGERIEDMEES